MADRFGSGAPAHGGEPCAATPRARGAVRPLPVHSLLPSDLPITREEIHKVLAALGPEIAGLFAEDE